jgi:hypothetical protein
MWHVFIKTVVNFGILLNIFFVEGYVGSTDLWAPNTGNSWRTTTDIQDNWASMISNIDNVE